MALNKYHIVIIVESLLLAVALGLGTWWYVHNKVVREVEKTFVDGSSYKGEWLAGRMHGHGVLAFADGDVYEGSFVEGRRCGNGKLVRADGSEYEGLWQDDRYHGQGRYVSPKGNVYEGGWSYVSRREGSRTRTGRMKESLRTCRPQA